MKAIRRALRVSAIRACDSSWNNAIQQEHLYQFARRRVGIRKIVPCFPTMLQSPIERRERAHGATDARLCDHRVDLRRKTRLAHIFAALHWDVKAHPKKSARPSYSALRSRELYHRSGTNGRRRIFVLLRHICNSTT